MNYAGHEKLRAEVAEVANAMCDLRARLNDMEHRCRFDSYVLVERLARQTLYRANRLFIDRNLNPQKIKKTPKKRMFIQHCLRAMSAPPSIKWILSIDTVYH